MFRLMYQIFSGRIYTRDSGEAESTRGSERRAGLSLITFYAIWRKSHLVTWFDSPLDHCYHDNLGSAGLEQGCVYQIKLQQLVH